MQHERRRNIVARIHKNQTIKISDLTKEFKVSIETIRRDLEFLESQGQLRRVYGGAILNDNYSLLEAKHEQRETTNHLQKKAIGDRAAALISHGDTLFIDMGTTTREFAQQLVDKKDLTILTNSLIIAQDLAKNTDESCSVLLLGGVVRRGELTVSGAITDSNLGNFYFAKVIIGLGGISVQTGLTDYHLHEAATRRMAIERAHAVIALADKSKFGVTALNYICPADSLDILVTDWEVPAAVLEEYRALGITVHTAQDPSA